MKRLTLEEKIKLIHAYCNESYNFSLLPPGNIESQQAIENSRKVIFKNLVRIGRNIGVRKLKSIDIEAHNEYIIARKWLKNVTNQGIYANCPDCKANRTKMSQPEGHDEI